MMYEVLIGLKAVTCVFFGGVGCGLVEGARGVGRRVVHLKNR